MSVPSAGTTAPRWTLRVFGLASISPAWVGVGLSLTFLLAFGLYVGAFGLWERLAYEGVGPWSNSFLWDNLVTALLVGYLPTITAYGLRGAKRDLADLRPAVRPASRFEELSAGVLELHPGRRRAFSLFAVGCYAAFLTAGLLSGRITEMQPAMGDPRHLLWSAGRVALIVWLGFSAAYFSLSTIRALTRLGAEHVDVDLFDLRPLAPFARHGLRTALLWIIGFSIFSLFRLTQHSGLVDVMSMLAILTLTAVCLVAPALGVRARIRERKRAELERIRAAIRHEREGDAGSRDPGGLADRIANLLAYEARIERVHEWPFDAPTVARALLYAALGIGSWSGAALVERLLGSILD